MLACGPGRPEHRRAVVEKSCPLSPRCYPYRWGSSSEKCPTCTLNTFIWFGKQMVKSGDSSLPTAGVSGLKYALTQAWCGVSFV